MRIPPIIQSSLQYAFPDFIPVYKEVAVEMFIFAACVPQRAFEKAFWHLLCQYEPFVL
jgi:hypothetical protein